MGRRFIIVFATIVTATAVVGVTVLVLRPSRQSTQPETLERDAANININPPPPPSVESTSTPQVIDSARISIHQFESQLHRWDDLKVDPAFPEFGRGKEYAQNGYLEKAKDEFRIGLKNNLDYAYFDIGLIAFYEGKFSEALSYFQDSCQVRDSLCLEYVENTQRILQERERVR